MVVIPLRRRGGALAGRAVVDVVDSDLAAVRWYLDQDGYARRCKLVGRKPDRRPVFRRLSVHKTVLERKLGRPVVHGSVTDHINGDRLDCRRANLREASAVVNQQNRRGADRRCASGYRNVSLNRVTGTYYVSVTKNGRAHTRGMFDTAEEAALVAAQMRKRLGLADEATPGPPVPRRLTVRVDGRAMNRNNTSGFRGVVFHSRLRRWVAQVSTGGRGGKTIYCGLFATPEEAARAAARKRAELERG